MANPFVQEPMATGLVRLRTNFGNIDVELWPKEAPKACRNFVQLSMEGFYDGCIFHRVVPGFVAQTGDPSGTGAGGDCIYDEGMFEDEYSARLKFARRGLLAMANTGKKHTNTSQIFFTLDRADELQNKNTIFGSVVGDTIYNVMKLGEVEIAPGSDDRPVYPPVINSVEVIDNPFDDIVPRTTADDRKAEAKARREAKMDREKEKRKLKHSKLAKNKGLLSFADEAEADSKADESAPKSKFLSAHDVDTSGRLSAKTAEGRSRHVGEIPDFVDSSGPPPPSRSEPAEPKKMHAALQAAVAGRLETEEPVDTKLKKSVGKQKVELSEADKVKAEIAQLTSDLRASRQDDPGSDSSEDARQRQKAAKLSRAALLAAEREKVFPSSGASKTKLVGGKKKRDETDIADRLEQFRKKIRMAVDVDEGADREERELGYAGEMDETQDGAVGDRDDDDAGWLGHSLRFRKDATVDIHKAEEYKVVDPLADKKWTLDELAARKLNRARDDGDRDRERDRDRDRGGSGRDRDRRAYDDRPRGGRAGFRGGRR